MVSVKVNGQDYAIATEWKDLTLAKCEELYALKMPDCLRHVYDVQLNSVGTPEEVEKKITEAEKLITIEEQHKTIPRYFGTVLMTLSDIPAEVIKKTDVISIKTMYHLYLKKLVEGVHFMPGDYPYKQISWFEFREQMYLLPVSSKVFNQLVPMADISALEFTESADLMIHLTTLQENRDISRIANLVSILCRPEGEQYDEKVSLARAEVFKELTMDVIWDVFFSLITPLVIFAQSVQISLLREMEAERIKEQKH